MDELINKVILGDSYELIKKVPDKSIDLCIIDPPYDIKVSHGAGAFGVKKKLNYKQLEKMSFSFDFWLLDEICRVLKKINIYIFCSKTQILPLLTYFVENKNCNWTLLTWHKTNVIPACGNSYIPDTEYCLFFRDQGVFVGGSPQSKATFYISQTNKKDKKLYAHPTPKPLAMVKNFILNSSNPGDVILDCFSGSGTTAVAAFETGRNFIAFEIDENYYKYSLERLQGTQQQMSLFNRYKDENP